MRKDFFAIVLLILTFSSFKCQAQVNTYETFDSTLVIHLFHGGGMLYESLDIYVRYDSCVRVDSQPGKETRTAFAMNQELRERIISIIRETNPSKIKQNDTKGSIRDASTKSICFNLNGHRGFCVMSSGSRSIRKSSQDDFTMLWSSLQEFSLNKGVIKKF